MTMRGMAAFPGSVTPRLVDVPEPREPGHGEVLCRTLQLGVCGTDREILLSKRPLTPHHDDFLILGHECLARIEAIGPGVGSLARGDLVVPVVRRAKQATTSQPTNLNRVDLLSFGQYTERGIVEEHGFSAPWWLDRAEHLHRIDPAMAPWAVLTEPFSVAEKGVNEAISAQSARLGEQVWGETPPRVLVTGMGPIGFAALAVCICRGWPTAMCGRDEPESSRASLCMDLGGSYVPVCEAHFDRRDAEADGFDLILECTGDERLMLEATQSLASRGVMVWLGSSRHPQPAEVNLAQMMRAGVLRNHIHIGSVNAAPRDFVDAIGHLDGLRQSKPKVLSDLITARISIGDAAWHYQHRQPQGIKTVVEYD